jgi:hypothetical protein
MAAIKALEAATAPGNSLQNGVPFGGQHDVPATTSPSAFQINLDADGLDIPGFLKRPSLFDLIAGATP